MRMNGEQQFQYFYGMNGEQAQRLILDQDHPEIGYTLVRMAAAHKDLNSRMQDCVVIQEELLGFRNRTSITHCYRAPLSTWCQNIGFEMSVFTQHLLIMVNGCKTRLESSIKWFNHVPFLLQV